jgi:CMP/dCMP kinase
MIVAIDGPAGAGKSTIARAVAEKLAWDYLDTGAMYRAVALRALERGIEAADDDGLTRLASDADIKVSGGTVLLDGTDVTGRIRADDVTSIVSRVSTVPGVRRAMARVQRAAAAAGDVVMEGRDIGSIVAPHAEVKVFLTASPEERARRRALQSNLPLTPEVLATVRAAIDERDARDESRSDSPLTRTPDAVLLDTTDLTVEQVVDRIVALVTERAAS